MRPTTPYNSPGAWQHGAHEPAGYSQGYCYFKQMQ